MNTAPETDAEPVPATAHKKQKLRISRWIWRPWYAKLWWISAAVYWTGFVLSFPIAPLRVLYESTLAGFLNVALYPPVMLMILSLGFIRSKLRRGDWVIVDGDPGLHRFNRSAGGSLDPYSDPLDHRSGSLWVGSPQSRARLFGREWP